MNKCNSSVWKEKRENLLTGIEGECAIRSPLNKPNDGVSVLKLDQFYNFRTVVHTPIKD